MRVALGSDHGGFNLKELIRNHLREHNIPFEDFGTYNEEAVDYPDFALPVAEAVAAGRFERGILVCGTGIGISVAANKVHGIRAALCHETFSARASREHNDANILALGERVVGPGIALEIVDLWLETDFLSGRHQQRIDKIRKIEEKYSSSELAK